jgi:hypothetical protein
LECCYVLRSLAASCSYNFIFPRGPPSLV